MGQKYCDKCEVAVDQAILECPTCGHKKFVPGTVIWKRGTSKPSTHVAPSAETEEHFVRPFAEQKPISSTVKPTPKPQPTPDTNVAFSKTGKTIDDLIRAQNRTTHAVRAFVRFLFIQLTGITLAVFIWNLSLVFIDDQGSGTVFLQFCAGIVWIVTVVWSSYAGWEELNKSDIN